MNKQKTYTSTNLRRKISKKRLYIWLLEIIVVSLYMPLEAGINFGSAQSAIKISNNGRFHLSKSLLSVDGSIMTRDGGSVTADSDKIIEFSRGILESNATEMTLTATYNPNLSGTTILLNGSDSLRAEPGTIIENISIANTENRITGQPSFNNTISFASNATLTLAIHNNLNQNIQLNDGTLYLESDLKCSDGVSIQGSGTIKFNSSSLEFGAQTITLANNIFWDNANDLQLNGKLVQSGISTFNGDCTINGNGNILDLRSGGTLFIAPSTTLNLTDITIKGLGDGGIVFAADTSKLVLSQVDIELAQSYTTTLGGIYVDGPSTFILQDKFFSFDQDASLSVDGVVLWTDRKGTPTTEQGLIVFGTPEENYFSSINSGTIKAKVYLSDLQSIEVIVNDHTGDIALLEGRMDTAETDIANNSHAILKNAADIDVLETIVSPSPIVGAPITGDIDFDVSSILNADEQINVIADATINGNGALIIFVKTDIPQFIVQNGVTVTLVNLHFQGINANTFQLGTNSKVIIGDNVSFGFSEDTVITGGKFELIGSTFKMYGEGGIRQITIGCPSCPCDEYGQQSSVRKEFEDCSSFNILDGTLELENIELTDLENFGNNPGTGTIKLCGSNIINIWENSDHKFIIEGTNNTFQLRANLIQLLGDLTYGTKSENILHIVHKIMSEVVSLPNVIFGDGFLTVSSTAGISKIFFDDTVVRVTNRGYNSFVVGQNSYLGGNELQIWDYPIRQISDLFTQASGLVLSSNLDSAIERATGRYVPPALPEEEHIPGLHGYNIDSQGNARQLVFRSPFEVSRNFLNDIASLQNAHGTICLDDSIAQNFNIHPENSLILNLKNGSILKLANENVELKTNDTIIVSGENNIIHIPNAFTIKGNLVFDKESKLTFDFGKANEKKTPTLYVDPYTTLNPDAKIEFNGQGNVTWLFEN